MNELCGQAKAFVQKVSPGEADGTLLRIFTLNSIRHAEGEELRDAA